MRGCVRLYYSTSSGATSNQSCLLCPQHSRVMGTASVTSVSDCICDPGYTGTDGSGCSICPAGTYKSNPGSAACESCAPNAFSSGESCQRPVASRVPCILHQARVLSQVCSVSVTLGTSNLGRTVSCARRDTSKMAPTTAAASNATKILTNWIISGVPCMQFSSSVPGLTVCTCDAGYELRMGLCVACEAEGFNSYPNSSCIPCPLHSYSSATASMSCESCPLPSSSLTTGLDSIRGYVCDAGYAGG